MVRNQEKLEQAIRLRKRGFTLEEIAKYCDISKSTASKWLKNKGFSQTVTKQNKRRVGQENAKRLRLIAKARGTERTKRYKDVARESQLSYQHFSSQQLFVAGLMLYQAHADQKDDYKVRFSTTELAAHKVFIRFLTRYGGIELQQVHIWLLLSPLHSEERCMKRWKRETGLPYAQFYKNQIISSSSRKQPLHYGVGNTIIGSTVLQVRLRTWLQQLQKDLVKQ